MTPKESCLLEALKEIASFRSGGYCGGKEDPDNYNMERNMAISIAREAIASYEQDTGEVCPNCENVWNDPGLVQIAPNARGLKICDNPLHFRKSAEPLYTEEQMREAMIWCSENGGYPESKINDYIATQRSKVNE
jgi:hypothetical protein